jgi:Putative zinc-finger
MEQQIESRLWDYLDGALSTPERSEVEAMIESNLEWRAKYHELLEVQQFMKEATEPDEPSMRFTQNVMEQISRLHIAPATKNYINNKIIFGIAAFFLTIIGGFLIYGLSQMDWSAGTSTGSFIPNIQKLNVSKAFSNQFVTGFMMVNVVVGLALLDVILTQRKKRMMV